MTDDELRHHCLLASLTVAAIRDPDVDLADLAVERNGRNMLNILAEAFVELAERQEMKPRFRIKQKNTPRAEAPGGSCGEPQAGKE